MKRSCTIFFLSVLILSCRKSTDSVQSVIAKADTLELPSKINVTVNEEPGEPMTISGTVYLSDGKTPANGAILSLWQTDTNGYYVEGGGGAGELHPRLHGRLKTS